MNNLMRVCGLLWHVQLYLVARAFEKCYARFYLFAVILLFPSSVLMTILW